MHLHESFARHVYWPLVQRLKKEQAAKALEKLSGSQWKSRDELLNMQWQLVREVVNTAANNVSYYQKILTCLPC